MKNLSMKKTRDGYLATYKTLDLAVQGATKEEAKSNLLDLLILYIDYAIENSNIEAIFKKKR